MKVLLTVFCSLFALFFGGCAIMLLGQGDLNFGPLFFVPIIITALNLFVLFGLWDQTKKRPPAFYILGIVDVLTAAGVIGGIFMGASGYFALLAIFVAAVFLVKGFSTLSFAGRLRKETDAVK